MEIIVIVIGLIIDRITKVWAVKSLSVKGDIVIIKDIFGFSYLENRGAAFGIFQNKVSILSFVTLIIICIIIFYIIKYRPKNIFLKISLSLIIGGALGNLIDRIFYKYVVDFILFHYKNVYYFPTFNVADMMVVVGTFILAIYILKEDSYGK